MSDDSPLISPATGVTNKANKSINEHTPRSRNPFARRAKAYKGQSDAWDGRERRKSDRRASQQNRGPMLESRAGRDRRRQGRFSIKA